MPLNFSMTNFMISKFLKVYNIIFMKKYLSYMFMI